MFNPEDMVNNVNELQRRMDDPSVETGEDMNKYARESFIPEMRGGQSKQKGRGGDRLAANKAALQRYVSYLG